LEELLIDSGKLKSALSAAESFIRRIHQELKSTADADGSIAGTDFRVVGDVMYTDSFIHELSELEEMTYEVVRNSEFMSKTAAEALLHKAISSATLVDGKVVQVQEFEKALDSAIGELKKGLHNRPSEWSYLIRVAGFDPQCLPAIIGKVRFALMDESEMETFEKDLKNELMRNSTRARYAGEVGAFVNPTAVDRDAALELAIREVRKTLDVINFFAASSYPPFIGVHLPWESSGTHEQFIGILRGKEVVAHGRLQGPAVKLNLETIDETPLFKRAKELLSKERLNSFEQRMLSALQWAGRASFQERIDQAFLFYAISLENLLLGTKNEVELSYRLSVFGAHLLAKRGQDRSQIHKNLRRLYKLRSILVHAGSTSVRDIDLGLIRKYAKTGIAIMLTSEAFLKIQTEEELNDYLQSSVLGSSDL
jgi:hypothetical protein